MTKLERILNSIANKNIFEYLFIDRELNIVHMSLGLSQYFDQNPVIGEPILSYMPELYECGENIEEIFTIKDKICQFELIQKKSFYVNVSIDYYNEEMALVLLENVTELTKAKQNILQSNNETTLMYEIFKKFFNEQSTLIFVTDNQNKIKFANKIFLEYFNIQEEELIEKDHLLYKHINSSLTSYEDLFDYIQNNESHITIHNDTFIVEVKVIESIYKLFTFSKVTNIIEKKKILEEELEIDSLTGVYRKKYFDFKLEKLLLDSKLFALVVIDIDNFKIINDNYGHLVGDKTLIEFAKLIKGTIRKEDLIARWGGEEFLLIVSTDNIDKAMDRMNLLLTTINNHKFKNVGHLTASLGLAWRDQKDNVDSLLLRADKALYKAKSNGKNQLILKTIEDV